MGSANSTREATHLLRETVHDNLAPIHGDHPVAKLKALFSSAHAVTPKALHAVYDDAVIFKDPVNAIHGLKPLIEHTLSLYENLNHCEFDYHGEVVEEDKAVIRWTMTFSHPRLQKGQSIRVPGMTYIEWHEKIVYHEDSFDLGCMLYQRVPILGKLINFLNGKLRA